MKDPGSIKIGSEMHKAAVLFAEELSKQFGMARPAAFGQVIRFYEVLREVTQNENGMASLLMGVEKGEPK